MMRLFSVALLLIAITGCKEPEQKVIEKSAVEHGLALMSDTAVSGSTLNEATCSMCHPTRATDAGIFPGAPMAGMTSRPSYWGGSELSLLRSINHCLYYFMLADAPWTGEEEEARAIYAYLESLEESATEKEKAAQPLTFAPLFTYTGGDATRGDELYEEACATCHGAKESGAGAMIARAPTLPQDTIATHPKETYTKEDLRLVFVEKTRHGLFFGYGGEMPPFPDQALSDDDIADILAYLGVP
jgi:thiosulfate dehydrogenase